MELLNIFEVIINLFSCSRRVSDGKFRRTNYRLVVQNISSGTSWQVLTQIIFSFYYVNTNVIFIFTGSIFNF